MPLMMTVGMVYFPLRDGTALKYWWLIALPVVVLTAMLIWYVKAARKARDGIRYHVRLTPEHISVRQTSGEIRMPWRAIAHVREQSGILVIRSATAVIALPWYNLSEVQKSAINSYLAAHPAATRQSANSKLILWAVLIALFTVIYFVQHR